MARCAGSRPKAFAMSRQDLSPVVPTRRFRLLSYGRPGGILHSGTVNSPGASTKSVVAFHLSFTVIGRIPSIAAREASRNGTEMLGSALPKRAISDNSGRLEEYARLHPGNAVAIVADCVWSGSPMSRHAISARKRALWKPQRRSKHLVYISTSNRFALGCFIVAPRKLLPNNHGQQGSSNDQIGPAWGPVRITRSAMPTCTGNHIDRASLVAVCDAARGRLHRVEVQESGALRNR